MVLGRVEECVDRHGLVALGNCEGLHDRYYFTFGSPHHGTIGVADAFHSELFGAAEAHSAAISPAGIFASSLYSDHSVPKTTQSPAVPAESITGLRGLLALLCSGLLTCSGLGGSGGPCLVVAMCPVMRAAASTSETSGVTQWLGTQ